MAKILNQEKARAKSWALTQVSRTEMEVSQLLSKVEGLLAQLDYAVSGAPSGMDRQLIGLCQRTQRDLSAALQQLSSAGAAIASLDAFEEVPDAYRNGGHP